MGQGVHLNVFVRSRGVIHWFILVRGCYLGSGQRKEGRVVSKHQSKYQKAPAQGLRQLLPPVRQSQGLGFLSSVLLPLNEYNREGFSLPVNWGMGFLLLFVIPSLSQLNTWIIDFETNESVNLWLTSTRSWANSLTFVTWVSSSLMQGWKHILLCRWLN